MEEAVEKSFDQKINDAKKLLDLYKKMNDQSRTSWFKAIMNDAKDEKEAVNAADFIVTLISTAKEAGIK